MDFSQIIKKPLITEKSSVGAEKGKHTFLVNPKATKIDVKKAIEKLYGVRVAKVNTLSIKPKTKIGRKRAIIQKRNPGKKVTITLAPGQKFDVNKFKEPKK